MRRNDLRKSTRDGDGNPQNRRGASNDEVRRRATSSSGEGTNQTRDARQDGAGSANPETSDPAVTHLENLKRQIDREIQQKVQQAALTFSNNPAFRNLSCDLQSQAIDQVLDRPGVWNVIDPLHHQIKFLDQTKSVHLLQQELGESSAPQENILNLDIRELHRMSSDTNTFKELTYQISKLHLELLKKKADGMIKNRGQLQDTIQTLNRAKDLLSDMATHLQHNYRDDEGTYIYQRGHEIDAMLSQVERR